MYEICCVIFLQLDTAKSSQKLFRYKDFKSTAVNVLVKSQHLAHTVKPILSANIEATAIDFQLPVGELKVAAVYSNLSSLLNFENMRTIYLNDDNISKIAVGDFITKHMAWNCITTNSNMARNSLASHFWRILELQRSFPQNKTLNKTIDYVNLSYLSNKTKTPCLKTTERVDSPPRFRTKK